MKATHFSPPSKISYKRSSYKRSSSRHSSYRHSLSKRSASKHSSSPIFHFLFPTSLLLALFAFTLLPRSAEAQRRCRPGRHKAKSGKCVRDNCPLGWMRGKDSKCRRRKGCPKGFLKRGRLCVQAKCPRGYKRDKKKRCVPNISLRCGAGAFRNPAGICVLVPRIKDKETKKQNTKAKKPKQRTKKPAARRSKTKKRSSSKKQK